MYNLYTHINVFRHVPITYAIHMGSSMHKHTCTPAWTHTHSHISHTPLTACRKCGFHPTHTHLPACPSPRLAAPPHSTPPCPTRSPNSGLDSPLLPTCSEPASWKVKPSPPACHLAVGAPGQTGQQRNCSELPGGPGLDSALAKPSLFQGSYLVHKDPVAVLGSQVGLHGLQREKSSGE